VSRRRSATGVLPSLDELGVTVELRAVQQKKYEWGTPLADYKPCIGDLVGVASIHIGVDSGDRREFHFQVDERELQFLIDGLTAAKADLQALRNSVSFRTIPPEADYGCGV